MTLYVGGVRRGGAERGVRLRRCAGHRAAADEVVRPRGGAGAVILPVTLRPLVRHARRGRARRALAGRPAGRDGDRDPAVPALDIDIVINRTVVYAALTVLLAAAYVATSWRSAPRSARGSAWITARATLLVAAAFRPLRARVQDLVDRRFDRPATTRCAGWPSSSRTVRAGRRRRRRWSRCCATCSTTRRAAAPRARAGRSRRARHRADDPAATAGCASDRPARRRALRPAAPSRRRRRRRLRRGLAIEIARLQVELRGQPGRGPGVPGADRGRRPRGAPPHRARPARRRPAAAGLDRAWRCATPSTSSVDTPRRGSTTLDDAVAEITAVIDELRELAHGLPPSQLDAGLAAAFAELARRAPMPVDVRALDERVAPRSRPPRSSSRCEGLTNAVKHARATPVSLTAERDNGRLVVSGRRRRRRWGRTADGSGLAASPTA